MTSAGGIHTWTVAREPRRRSTCPEGCREAGPGTKGIRSSVTGTCVILAVGVVVVAEHADRVRGRLGAALHAQLGEQRGHVVLHGLLGQEHLLADLPVGQPFPDQLQDPALLTGQPGQRSRFADWSRSLAIS